VIDTYIKPIVLTNSRFVFTSNCSDGCKGRQSCGQRLGGRRCHDRPDRITARQRRPARRRDSDQNLIFFVKCFLTGETDESSTVDRASQSFSFLAIFYFFCVLICFFLFWLICFPEWRPSCFTILFFS